MLACPRCNHLNQDVDRRCASCGASLVGAIQVNDASELATRTVEAQRSQGSLGSGVLWSAGLGLAGVVIWLTLNRMTDWDLNFLVLVIGLGAGWGMSRGSGHSVSGSSGALALGFMIIGLLMTKSVMVSWTLADLKAESLTEATSDEAMTHVLAESIYEERLDQNLPIDDDFNEEGYPVNVWEEAVDEWESMTTIEREPHLVRARNEVESLHGELEESLGGLMTFFFSLSGLGWTIGAGIMTYKLGSSHSASS